MCESIVSKITHIVRNTARAIGATIDRSPWIVAAAFLVVLFLV